MQKSRPDSNLDSTLGSAKSVKDLSWGDGMGEETLLVVVQQKWKMVMAWHALYIHKICSVQLL